jgi:hypothetical protein
MISFLLALSTIHCVRAIFFTNVSWVDLRRYSHGAERMPFQGRVAMVPILRWAGDNDEVKRIASLLDREEKHQLGRQSEMCSEPLSPEKLASIGVGLASSLLAVAWLAVIGWRRFGTLWWLPSVIFTPRWPQDTRKLIGTHTTSRISCYSGALACV